MNDEELVPDLPTIEEMINAVSEYISFKKRLKIRIYLRTGSEELLNKDLMLLEVAFKIMQRDLNSMFSGAASHYWTRR
jgi:hypothetical protein